MESAKGLLKNGATPDVVSHAKETLADIATALIPAIVDVIHFTSISTDQISLMQDVWKSSKKDGQQAYAVSSDGKGPRSCSKMVQLQMLLVLPKKLLQEGDGTWRAHQVSDRWTSFGLVISAVTTRWI